VKIYVAGSGAAQEKRKTGRNPGTIKIDMLIYFFEGVLRDECFQGFSRECKPREYGHILMLPEEPMAQNRQSLKKCETMCLGADTK
jgi:hypothetical protein